VKRLAAILCLLVLAAGCRQAADGGTAAALDAEASVTIHTAAGDVRGLILPGATATARRLVIPDGRGLEVWDMTPAGKSSPTPKPDPIPDPTPKPDPKPNPSPSKTTALFFLHESADSTPAAAALREASAWRKTADAAGIRWIVLDVDTAAKSYPNAAQKARAVGLPALVWSRADGTGEAQKAPASAEELAALIRSRNPSTKGPRL
jgi:hypothetical protein